MAMYSDEEFFKVLNKLIDIQLNDIEKSFSAETDILCVIGCMNLIEFMGGIRNGKLGQKGSVIGSVSFSAFQVETTGSTAQNGELSASVDKPQAICDP